MKKIFKIIAGFVIALLLIFVAAFYFTAELPKTADKFFTAAKNKNMELAYSYASDGFKQVTSQEALESFLQKNGFDQYKDSSWNSRNVTNNTGKLTGYILTDTDNKLPLTIDFIKSQDGWKIHALNKPPSGVQNNNQTAQMPSEKELVSLINKTMASFAQSISQKNMQLLRDDSSSLFKKQVSLDEFNKAYQSFFKFEDKLLILDKFSPQFTQKSLINEDGVLIIQGKYPTTPSALVFVSKYVYEGYGWKLLGLNVNIK
jgi:hypothetical protein